MRIDIRLPMGLMFSIMGLILAVFGLISRHSDIYTRKSLGIDVNLWWGLALLAFGLAMLALSWRAAQRRANGDHATSAQTQDTAAEHEAASR